MGEDMPDQHALPVIQIRYGKWSKNNQDVMKFFCVPRYSSRVPGKLYSNN